MSANLLWAEVDLKAIAHNTRELRRVISPKAKLMVAVKADGYGHGAVKVSQTALANGAAALGVARVEEGIALRNAGINAPILILGYTLPQFTGDLLKYNLTQTLYDLDTAKAFSQAVAGHELSPLKVHIKVDTGMGRLGVLSPATSDNWPGVEYTHDTVSIIKTMVQLPGVTAEGIFTHFASSDSHDKTYAESQFKRFTQLLNQLEDEGIFFSIKHAANSGAVIDMPHTHLDMVRAGISFYGLYPSTEVIRDQISLKPAMSLKAKVIHVKRVPAEFAVSYNSTWKSCAETTIATVPVGYADGYFRGLSNCGEMLLHGCRAPIVGRICMDLTLLDVGHIPNVKVGDEVVLFGRQQDQFLSVDELAAKLNTINYEIVSVLKARVPRVYLV